MAGPVTRSRPDGSTMLVALGGNAIVPPGSVGAATDQAAAIARAMDQVAGLVAGGRQVVLTHGNGPQVGNVLVKNELSRAVAPPVPLDWCVAQTQATIGFTMVSALEGALAARGVARPVVVVVSRVRVAADDPAWSRPSKPVGRYLPDGSEALARAQEAGHPLRRHEGRGWRRVVPSPEPLESLDLVAVATLVAAGAVVVANGGGGIPVVVGPDGQRGVEAVVDKDLAAARLAVELAVDALVIVTDVEGVAVDFGGPGERWLGEVAVADLRRLVGEGHFEDGSMGPKVEAACRFVEATGRPAAIGGLDQLHAVGSGTAGTRVVPGSGGRS